MRWGRSVCLLSAFFLCWGPTTAQAARDASFLAPSAATSAPTTRGEGAVGVEPKNDIDLGDTGLGVAKRTTIFFVNLTNLPVGIVSVTANGDSNVDAEIVSDDCSKEGKIAAASRCAVSVEVTPKGSGQWTAEILMTHEGSGRLARVKLTGKTSLSADKKSTGLSLSAKDMKPIEFGNLELGGGKAVRSALMVNDSNEPITVLSIEVIAAENGLERLEQGCMEDMDLRPGESCPVTLLWEPKNAGAVSTDLIIRHSGQLGFAVIPVRGVAREGKSAEGTSAPSGKAASGPVPLSPTADEVEKAMADKILALSAGGVPSSALAEDKGFLRSAGDVHLIGTVGNKGLFYASGTSLVVAVGDEKPLGDGSVLKLLGLTPRQAEILLDGEKKTLGLEKVSELTSRASKKREQKDAEKEKTPSKKTTRSKKESDASSDPERP